MNTSAHSQPEPSGNDTKQKSRHAGEIADLFRVLRNMSRDERVSEADFRIAFRISQAVKAGTGWAEIGDAALMDELPRTRDKGKLRLFRLSMTELGWLRIIEGVRGRATQYLFLEDNSAAIEERSEQARARRESKFNLRRIKRKTGLQVAALGRDINPTIGEILDEIRGESSPLNGTGSSEIRGESTVDKGCISPPLLPQRSTSGDPLPMEEMTQGEFPTASADLLDLDPLLMDHCESGCGQDADHVVKFGRHGKWQLRTICLECIPADYEVQRGDAEVFRLPAQ